MASQDGIERTGIRSLVGNAGSLVGNVGGFASSVGGTVLRFIKKEGRILNQEDLHPAERIPLLGHAVGGIRRKLGPLRNGVDVLETVEEVGTESEGSPPC